MTADDTDPADVLDELADEECIHIQSPNEYLCWRTDGDGEWFVLGMTSGGTWYPNPRVSHTEMVEALVGDAGRYSIAETDTTVPAGRLAGELP